MFLEYVGESGDSCAYKLGQDPVTIGRSRDAVVTLPDEQKRISRIHCTITCEDGQYMVTNCSKNGTLVNGVTVVKAELKAGDRIQIGPTVLTMKTKCSKGMDTIVRENYEIIDQEREKGKGFKTMMHDLVNEIDGKPKQRR